MRPRPSLKMSRNFRAAPGEVRELPLGVLWFAALTLSKSARRDSRASYPDSSPELTFRSGCWCCWATGSGLSGSAAYSGACTSAIAHATLAMRPFTRPSARCRARRCAPRSSGCGVSLGMRADPELEETSDADSIRTSSPFTSGRPRLTSESRPVINRATPSSERPRFGRRYPGQVQDAVLSFLRKSRSERLSRPSLPSVMCPTG